MKMKRVWRAEETYWTIALVECSFADRHGGECDYWNGKIYQSKKRAESAARAYSLRRSDGRFEVREHTLPASWALVGTLSLS